MIYPRIVAHRCGGALAPENTLAGLRIAARLGCRGVEFDAMLSADGVPVLVHDETLERTTDGRGEVARHSLSELRRLDAGGRHAPAFRGEPLPTLEEALRLCAALGLWANVEIKPSAGCERETGAAVARLLVSCWDGNGVVSSFSEAALTAARDGLAGVPFALLVAVPPDDWLLRLRRLGCNALHCRADQGLAVVAQAAAAGVPVACYTTNDRNEGERLLAAGVAAICTDRPDLWLPAEM